MKNVQKPMANPFVVLREEFDDWAVLFDPDSGNGFRLDPTAVYLWKLLDGEHSIEETLKALRRDAEGVPEEASDDIGIFVDALVAAGLAGFDSTGFGLLNSMERSEKVSSFPRTHVSPANRFRYESPQRGRHAAGSGTPCNFGSADTGLCNTGNYADKCCSSTGSYASGTNGIVISCFNGYYAEDSGCCTGYNTTGTICGMGSGHGTNCQGGRDTTCGTCSGGG